MFINKNEITVPDVKTYATRANLEKALADTGLDKHGSRYIVVQHNERWTAIFLASEWCAQNGGYAFFAGQHGFLSV